MRWRRFRSVVLVSVVGLLAACAAPTAAPPQAPPGPLTQADQVKVAKHIEQAKGHLAVALAAYQAGDMAHAKLHAGHPSQENLDVLEAPLKARDPALATALRQSLPAPVQALESRPNAPAFERAVADAGERLDQALRALVPAQVLADTSFRALVLLEMLEAVREEYGEAVEGGKVVSPEEYQDAYGFFVRARSLYQEIGAALAPDTRRQTEEEFSNLARALPGFAHPSSPVPLDRVQGWTESLARKLADATGVQIKRTDPVAEVATIKGYLDRILTTYEQGNAARATELAAEMYLDHYEKIEYMIIEKAPKLNGTLEPLLASKIRARIKAGAPVSELAALVRQAQAALDDAGKVLAGP